VAVIPAAGVGSRLRPHTHTVPKALISVAGKPMIAHILDELDGLGVREVTIVIGYMGDRIRHYVGKHYRHFEARFVEQLEREGLGHAIALTQGQAPGRRLLIVLGTRSSGRFQQRRRLAVQPSGCSGRRPAPLRHRRGRRRPAGDSPGQAEHPTSNLALVGIYYIANGDLLHECLAEIIRRDLRTRGEYQLTDALQLMLDRGEKMGIFHIQGWYDCGQPETLLATNRALLDMQAGGGGLVANGTGVILPPVAIDPSATILGSIIGPHVSVAPGRRPPLDCSQRHHPAGAIIEDVLLDASVIGDHAVVGVRSSSTSAIRRGGADLAR
jgi:glucose-1-phosphate thymidylyltransferase